MANAKLIVSTDSNGKQILTYTPEDLSTTVVLSGWVCDKRFDDVQIKDTFGRPLWNVKVSADNPVDTHEGTRTSGDDVREDIGSNLSSGGITALLNLLATLGDSGYSNAKGDFVATPAVGAKTVAITGLRFTLEVANVVLGGLVKVDTSGNVFLLDISSIVVSSGVITLANIDDFVSGDSVVAVFTGPDKTIDIGQDVQKIEEQAALPGWYSNGILDVDTTNISAATHYYPSATGASMDTFKDQSSTGKFIDADGTLTLTLEVTNDEDTTNADWKQVQFYDDNAAALIDSITVTNGTVVWAVSLNEMNFRHYRWVIVASGATNTVIKKVRNKAS